MFYRRKHYLVKPEIVESFNKHFNHTNLPEQLRNGSRLVGRWMKERDGEVEIFAIWEYDSYEDYVKIEKTIRSNMEHVKRVKAWYDKHGGKRRSVSEIFNRGEGRGNNLDPYISGFFKNLLFL